MDNDILVQNLNLIFNERNADRRLRALEALYVPSPSLYEPENVVEGQQAISDTVGRLLERLPPDFEFSAVGPSIGHHDRRCIRWRGGPRGGAPILSGIDVADLEGGKIRSLYVFIDAVAMG